MRRFAAAGLAFIAAAAAVLTGLPAVADGALRVSGVVVDGAGKPLANIGLGTTNGGSQVHTDADGHFSMPVPGGVQGLLLSRSRGEGFTDYTWFETESFSVTGSEDLGTIRFPELVEKTIKIVDASGNPVANASLYRGPGEEFRSPGWRDGGTTAFGNVHYQHAQHRLEQRTDSAGEVHVLVPRLDTNPDYTTKTPSGLPIYGIQYNDPDTGVVHHTDTSHSVVDGTTYTTALPAVARLTGKVVDGAGKPLANIGLGSTNGGSQVHTDADGHFSMPVPGGVQGLLLSRSRGEGFTDYTWFETESFSVTGSEDLGTIRFPELVEKTIKIVDASGNPVANASLYRGPGEEFRSPGWRDGGTTAFGNVHYQHAQHRLEQRTDSAGEVHVLVPRLDTNPDYTTKTPSGLPIYGIQYNDPDTGVVHHTDTSHSVVDGTTYTTALPAVARLTGKVVDGAGKPLANIGLGSTNGGSQVHTDADGHFSMPVPGGVQGLLLSRSRGEGFTDYTWFETESFSVTGSEDLGTIRFPELVEKTIKIVDASGNPVANASLYRGPGEEFRSPGWRDGGTTAFGNVHYQHAQHRLEQRTDSAGEVHVLVPRLDTNPDYTTKTPSGLPIYGIQYNDPDTGVVHHTDTSHSVVDGTTYTTALTGLALRVPDAPTSVSATLGDNSASVSWSPVSGNGSPVTGYTITSAPGGITKTVPGDQTTATVSGLSNGTGYTFTVKATNAIGTSPASTPTNSVTPAGQPDAPSGVSATRGDKSAQVSWSAVSGNGSPVTGYTITSAPGGITKTVPGDQTTATVSGLSNGTGYTFTVKATNAIGTSPASTPTNSVTPAGQPDAPSGVSATRGDKSAQVSWSAVSGNGSPVTGYTITSAPGGITKTVPGDQTTATVSGLSNGTGYTFTVKATNAIGTSAASAPSNEVVPFAPDTAAPQIAAFEFTPKSVNVNDGSKTVTVTARVTDATGAKTPSVIVSSDGTTQSEGFGAMTRVSGTATDGVYEKTITIPATAAAGSWTVKIYPLDDTLGNSDSTFHSHPTKLTVTNTAPDTAAPQIAAFEFTPKSVNVNDGSKTVTVTARVTDATGAKTPSVIVSSDGTTQSEGFGAMTRVSGTATDGVYEKTITIPATAAAGSWTVKIYPLDDTLGNSDSTFHSHPTKLTVTNTAPDTAAPQIAAFDFTPKSVNVNDGSKTVTVTARVTDATGAKTPTVIVSSDGTTQSEGFGAMTRVSGTATDGVYEKTITIPATAAAGSWTVKIYPLDDTLGNSDSTFHSHPTKLTVTNTAPETAPSSPANVSAVRGDRSAAVSWNAPSGNGSPVTGYTITSAPGGITKTVPGDQTSATVSGLTNGTGYTFTVKATNAVGTSAASAPSNLVTPAAVPDAPTSVSSTPRDKSAEVSWTAASGNGSPVTGYTITSAPGGITKTVPGDQTSATVSGLTNGTGYTFTVKATNAIGDSSASAPSTAVTPSEAVVAFGRADLSVAENAGTASLTVTRSGNTTSQSSVNYRRIAGSATAGTDFTLPAGTLTFQPGETTKTIPLTVTNDASIEAGETIVVSLDSPTAGTALTSLASMTVTISASDQRPDGLISTSASTSYVGNNVYNTTGAGQVKTVSARRTVTRTFYARVYNDGNVSNAISIRGSAALAGSTVRYYSGSTNVTTAMRSASGWKVTLNPGAYKVVTVKITIARTASFGSYKSATVTSSWTGDTTRSDAVKAVAKVIR